MRYHENGEKFSRGKKSRRGQIQIAFIDSNTGNGWTRQTNCVCVKDGAPLGPQQTRSRLPLRLGWTTNACRVSPVNQRWRLTISSVESGKLSISNQHFAFG